MTEKEDLITQNFGSFNSETNNKRLPAFDDILRIHIDLNENLYESDEDNKCFEESENVFIEGKNNLKTKEKKVMFDASRNKVKISDHLASLSKQKLDHKSVKNNLFKLDNLSESINQSKFRLSSESLSCDKQKELTGLEYLNGYWMRLPKKNKGLSGVFDFTNQNKPISEMLEKNHATKINPNLISSSENQYFSMQTKIKNDKNLNSVKSNTSLQKELSTVNLNLPFINKNQQIIKAPISYYKMNRFFILNKKLDNLSALVFDPYDPSKYQKRLSFNNSKEFQIEGCKIEPKKKISSIDLNHKDSKLAIFEQKLSNLFR